MTTASPPTPPALSLDEDLSSKVRRLFWIFLIPCVVALFVVVRLLHFQILLHSTEDTASYVDRNIVDVPTRGVITDNRGDLLAGDAWSFQFVIPRLGEMPPSYRDVVAHLLAGVAEISREELEVELQAELRSLEVRRQAEESRALAANEDPVPVYAYVVMADQLDLPLGNYLSQLQRQGAVAASLWDLHLTGDDNALRQLEALLEPDPAATSETLAAEPDLKAVMDNLGLRTRLDAEEADFAFFRHFQLVLQPTRYYTQGSLASHILGLVNHDREGANGIESYYQKHLRGEVNLINVADPISMLPPATRRFVPSYMGGDLVLTVDRSIQHIVEQELGYAITKYRVRQGGTAIVMEPGTGAILAMANLPDFDPGRLEALEPQSTNLTNLAVTGVYEPGSVFKILTVAMGLDLGVVQPDDRFVDTGEYEIGTSAVIKNSEERVAGEVNATEALARSLNTVMAQIAVERIGPTDFYDYLFQFGLGEVTGIDLAYEFNGSLKDKYPGTANWNITDLGANSFGQGINLTPIQMVNAVNVIANGGDLMKPYVVQHRINDDLFTSFTPTPLREGILAPRTIRDITEMMVYTVEETVFQAQVSGYRVAGKSGTAQVPDPDRIGQYSEDSVIASFIGFAPADNPRVTMLIVLNDPDPENQVVWGSQNAAPTFSRMAKRILEYLNEPPACHPDCYTSPTEPPAPDPEPAGINA